MSTECSLAESKPAVRKTMANFNGKSSGANGEPVRSKRNKVLARCASASATGKRRKPVTVVESPDWLPKGWVTELKTRGTGLSAGTKDKYFFDPVSNRRFRSRKEVFNFLETGKLGRYRPKQKKGDVRGKISAENAASPSEPAGNATTSTPPSSVLNSFGQSESTDLSKRPSKVRWVLNSSEGSWVPFFGDEGMNGLGKKEGELIFDLNGICGDACGDEHLKTAVSEDFCPCKRGKNEGREGEIDSRKQGASSPIVSPFGDSWPDPCLEFAVKTLTGALPVLDDNLALQDALQNYFLPQENADQKLCSNSAKPDPLGSDALIDGSGCNQYAEYPSSAEQKLALSRKELRGNKACRNTLSTTDSLPDRGTLNKYAHARKVKRFTRQQAGNKDCQNMLSATDSLSDRGTLNKYACAGKVKRFMRQQAKDLLEPLGRKLCKQAVTFLKESGHPRLFFEKQTKSISMPSNLSQNIQTDCSNPEQGSLGSSCT